MVVVAVNQCGPEPRNLNGRPDAQQLDHETLSPEPQPSFSFEPGSLHPICLLDLHMAEEDSYLVPKRSDRQLGTPANLDVKSPMSYTYQPGQRWEPTFQVRRFFSQVNRTRFVNTARLYITYPLRRAASKGLDHREKADAPVPLLVNAGSAIY